MRKATMGPLVLGLVVTSMAGAAAAQTRPQTPSAPQILVERNVHVSLTHEDVNHYEVEIRAHPTDASRLIACSMFRDAGRFGMRVWVSNDGGRTWQHSLEVTEGSTADPTCTFARNGTAYFVSTNTGTNRFRVFRSPDGGRTWLPPVLTPEALTVDRQYITVDNTGGPNDGTVYLTSWGGAMQQGGRAAGAGDDSSGTGRSQSAVNLWTSRDAGATWSPSAQVLASPGYRFDNSSLPVVVRDGSVLMSVIETESGNAPGAQRRILGDEPFQCRLNNQNARYLLIGSRDGGATLQQVSRISNACWVGLSALWPDARKALAVDMTDGPFRDRLYAAWLDRRNGHAEVWFTYSADNGVTWSAPQVIDANRATSHPRHDDFHPMLAVNSAGVVGLAWFDRRDHADNLSHTIRFSASLDGGVTWVSSVPVASAPNDARKMESWAIAGGGQAVRGSGDYRVTVQKFTFPGGDTHGMDASADGAFHPLWIDNRTGMAQVWTARVRVNGTVSEFGDSALVSYRDLRNVVDLTLAQPAVDSREGVLSFPVRLRNTSSDTVRGPFVVQVTNISSPMTVASVVNATNGRAGPGAFWRLNVESLAPGETRLVEGRDALVFRLDPERMRIFTVRTTGATYGVLLNLGLRVLAK